jgi:hypothetical protein
MALSVAMRSISFEERAGAGPFVIIFVTAQVQTKRPAMSVPSN